jgi:hypothetical protein
MAMKASFTSIDNPEKLFMFSIMFSGIESQRLNNRTPQKINMLINNPRMGYATTSSAHNTRSFRLSMPFLPPTD